MQQYLAIFLTAVITVTTVIYTFYSVQLWKTSKHSAEISRQAALGNLWSELNNYIEICKQEGKQETQFLRELSDIIAEFMIASLLTNINKRDDGLVKEFQRKIEVLVKSQKFDVSSIKWIAPMMGKK